ncbi:MAG: hypothetical protein GY701_09705 [Sulfitobacter sp.]|nr:hypothetical protein [Sulfitobacter sp.]
MSSGSGSGNNNNSHVHALGESVHASAMADDMREEILSVFPKDFGRVSTFWSVFRQFLTFFGPNLAQMILLLLRKLCRQMVQELPSMRPVHAPSQEHTLEEKLPGREMYRPTNQRIPKPSVCCFVSIADCGSRALSKK